MPLSTVYECVCEWVNVRHKLYSAFAIYCKCSPFTNTIIPNRVVKKLLDLRLSQHICRWIKDFLSNCSQRVKVGPHLPSAPAPHRAQSPLLYTHDCTPTHPENAIIKFADDTTIVGLISGGDETASREETQLILNTSKAKELIIDFRRNKTDIQPVCINGESLERASDFRFLGLTWTVNSSTIQKKRPNRDCTSYGY